MRLLLLSLLLVSSVAAAAEEALLAEPGAFPFTATLDDTATSFEAKVTNQSPAELTFLTFKGGCGCITHTLSAKSLAPGASATLRVAFEFRESTGVQKRKISLYYKLANDEKEYKKEIVISGDIPTALTFSKKAAIWMYGEKADSKTILIKIKPDSQIRELHVEDPDANHFVKATAKLDDAKQEYTITFTPTSTDIEVVSPTEHVNLQVPYNVQYITKSGVHKYEKIWVLLAKTPAQHAEPGAPLP